MVTIGIVDSLTTPPFAALNQVLDEDGPFPYGDYTLPYFTTSGAFLLPAGTYDIGGTFGVYVVVRRIPDRAGVFFGWDDPTLPIASGHRYQDRIAQLCLLRKLPISGAVLVTEIHDCYYIQELFLWPLMLGAGSGFPFVETSVGLHVNPGFEVDLFFLCVL